jgi:predicted acylesterase/phospholipase RssA
MASPAPLTDEQLRTSATRRLLDAIDFTFIPEVVEKKFHQSLLKCLSASAQFRHVLGLIERGGWFSADAFISWLGSKLDFGTWKGGKRAFSGVTLEQFFAATGVELSVVASDTTDASLLVLNHRTAPDCPLVWAIRMSMSIPFVWDEVIWRQEWGEYLSRNISDHAVVDGGLLSNFPIELLISDAPQVTKLIGPKSGNPILGLLIDEKLPVSQAKGLFVNFDMKLSDLATIERLRRLVDTATGAHDKMVMDEYSDLVVHLPAQGYSTTEFDMTEERRVALVAAGRSAMARYFAEHSSSAVPISRLTKGVALRSSTVDRIATSILQQGDSERSAFNVTR